MAAFASCRRSGWVRLLVVIFCALFIFATIATPPAYAVGETAALFGAAAVLSAAVAALGFKLSNDADGIATLNRMVSDFAKEAWALNLLVVGNRINGLIDGMNYIKMAVHNGKTYLDERVVAWCQQWLGNNGVYDAGGFNVPVENQVPNLQSVDYVLSAASGLSFYSDVSSSFYGIVNHYNLDLSGKLWQFSFFGTDTGYTNSYRCFISVSNSIPSAITFSENSYGGATFYRNRITLPYEQYYFNSSDSSFNHFTLNGVFSANSTTSSSFDGLFSTPFLLDGYENPFKSYDFIFSNYFPALSSGNETGLSGTDTIGADYKDKTLDQILDGLKTWAQDWYDAGADSATNTVAGAKDLPVTVGDQAATANPALNPDVVYNPPFSIPWPGVRSGETSSGAISDGKANADAAQTATTDVAENQTIIDSLVNWALNYINPDTGLFSKFPLCVPYDAYLLVTSSLGVDAVGSDSIFGASPGDLNGVVSQDIETYSDFQPIINIKHDFQLDGATYPLELTIDLTPWQPLVTFFREGMALLLVAELIGAEFKRIRGH